MIFVADQMGQTLEVFEIDENIGTLALKEVKVSENHPTFVGEL